MSNNLNEFNTIFSQLIVQNIMFNDSIKAMFLLVTLLESWGTFCTTISNSTLMDGLTCADVESNLLTEEDTHNNVDANKSSSTMTIRGRSQARGKSRERERDHALSQDTERTLSDIIVVRKVT